VRLAGGFTVGALVAAVSVVAVFGAVGQFLPSRECAALALLAYLAALWWHLLKRWRFPGDRRGVQANRHLVQGMPGRLYFGALLGAGILTEMSTPLVWSGMFFGLAGGALVAACYGLGFGLGRSAPSLAAVPLYRHDVDYGAVASRVAVSMRQFGRHVGVFVATFGAFLCIVIAALGR
jgi:hypothetical protein